MSTRFSDQIVRTKGLEYFQHSAFAELVVPSFIASTLRAIAMIVVLTPTFGLIGCGNICNEQHKLLKEAENKCNDNSIDATIRERGCEDAKSAQKVINQMRERKECK